MKERMAAVWVLLLFFALLLPPPRPVLGLSAVDLNTASEQDLESLPGIGPSTARSIVAARPFKSVDDLKTVKGIGPAKFDTLKPLVAVETQAPNPVATNVSKMKVSEKVNINSAGLGELDRLPGIGPKKAQAIIDGRPYKTVDDLLKVKGIKNKTLAKIRDYITVD